MLVPMSPRTASHTVHGPYRSGRSSRLMDMHRRVVITRSSTEFVHLAKLQPRARQTITPHLSGPRRPLSTFCRYDLITAQIQLR